MKRGLIVLLEMKRSLWREIILLRSRKWSQRRSYHHWFSLPEGKTRCIQNTKIDVQFAVSAFLSLFLLSWEWWLWRKTIFCLAQIRIWEKDVKCSPPQATLLLFCLEILEPRSKNLRRTEKAPWKAWRVRASLIYKSKMEILGYWKWKFK